MWSFVLHSCAYTIGDIVVTQDAQYVHTTMKHGQINMKTTIKGLEFK